MTVKFYFPDDEYFDRVFWGDDPHIMTEGIIRRLADDWEIPFDKLIEEFHEATREEFETYDTLVTFEEDEYIVKMWKNGKDYAVLFY